MKSDKKLKHINWLISLRNAVGKLDVMIHDEIAELAIHELGKMHRDLEFDFYTIGKFDIMGKRKGATVLVADVTATTKQTMPNNVKMRVREKLDGMAKTKYRYKYEITVSESAAAFLKKCLEEKKYNGIKHINIRLN